MNAYYAELYDYAYWANLEVVRKLQALERPPTKALQWLAHVLAAERVWLARLNGHDSTKLPIWPELSLDECERLMEDNRRGYREYAEALSEDRLQEKVAYKNSQGTSFETSVRHILTHVAMHGGYHRGQIAALLRQEGYEPVSTDFIRYARLLDGPGI